MFKSIISTNSRMFFGQRQPTAKHITTNSSQYLGMVKLPNFLVPILSYSHIISSCSTSVHQYGTGAVRSGMIGISASKFAEIESFSDKRPSSQAPSKEVEAECINRFRSVARETGECSWLNPRIFGRNNDWRGWESRLQLLVNISSHGKERRHRGRWESSPVHLHRCVMKLKEFDGTIRLQDPIESFPSSQATTDLILIIGRFYFTLIAYWVASYSANSIHLGASQTRPPNHPSWIISSNKPSNSWLPQFEKPPYSKHLRTESVNLPRVIPQK